MRQHRCFKDEHGFLLETSRPWSGNKDDGRGDAVGRTVLAAIAYGEKDFIDAFQSCFWIDINGRWQGIRHPEVTERKDLSRDHTFWWVLGLKYFNPTNLWKTLKIPWRISTKFKQTIDLWLWIRAVARGGWFWRFAYWVVGGAVFRVYLRAIQLAVLVGGFKTVPYKEFKATSVVDLTKRQRWGRKIMQICPSYTVHQLAWMLTCLPEGWFKRRMQKLVLRMVEPTNYLIRLLCNDTLNDYEWVASKYYTGVDGCRWNRRMDESTNIDLYALSGSQPEYNLDVDILQTIMKQNK